MKKNDGLSKESFLEVDDKINEETPNEHFKNKSVYLLHYPKGNNIKKSEGIIKIIKEDNYNMDHLCDSSSGSSGGPLLNFSNYKVVEIHKGGASKGKNWNVATFLRIPIQNFIEKYRDNESKDFSDDLNLKKKKKIFQLFQIPKEKMNSKLELLIQ